VDLVVNALIILASFLVTSKLNDTCSFTQHLRTQISLTSIRLEI